MPSESKAATFTKGVEEADAIGGEYDEMEGDRRVAPSGIGCQLWEGERVARGKGVAIPCIGVARGGKSIAMGGVEHCELQVYYAVASLHVKVLVRIGSCS